MLRYLIGSYDSAMNLHINPDKNNPNIIPSIKRFKLLKLDTSVHNGLEKERVSTTKSVVDTQNLGSFAYDFELL